ncbi:MAG: hypothetical protein LZF86_220011 [Nitrospira sp.]|nr:MAG: hypothetical protein LZF86_220011 [Nitrospira sp.]
MRRASVGDVLGAMHAYLDVHPGVRSHAHHLHLALDRIEMAT